MEILSIKLNGDETFDPQPGDVIFVGMGNGSWHIREFIGYAPDKFFVCRCAGSESTTEEYREPNETSLSAWAKAKPCPVIERHRAGRLDQLNLESMRSFASEAINIIKEFAEAEITVATNLQDGLIRQQERAQRFVDEHDPLRKNPGSVEAVDQEQNDNNVGLPRNRRTDISTPNFCSPDTCWQ